MVAEEMPEFGDELPIFCGRLTNSQGEPLALVTEDFSQGGRFEVHPANPERLPHELSRLFDGHTLNPVDLLSLCFEANGKRRLGDFDQILSSIVKMSETDRLFPVDDIDDTDDMRKRFILRLDYKL